MRTAEVENLPYTLNARQVADILGISRNAAYTLMHSGGFPTLHVGKRLLVQKERFFRWMDEQAQ